MSSVIKTGTIFINRDCLIEAIKATGTEVISVSENEIKVNRTDYLGYQKFILEGGRYVFTYDSLADKYGSRIGRNNLKQWKPVSDWLKDVDMEYRNLYKEYVEKQSDSTIENDNLKLQGIINSYRKQIVAKAHEEGYSIKEIEENGKIRLVLTRSTY